MAKIDHCRYEIISLKEIIMNLNMIIFLKLDIFLKIFKSEIRIKFLNLIFQEA